MAVQLELKAALVKIANHMDLPTIGSSAQVCKLWNQAMELPLAQALLNHPLPKVESQRYTALIAAARNGDLYHALNTFEQAKQLPKAEGYMIYTTFIEAAAKAGDVTLAREAFEKAKMHHGKVDNVQFSPYKINPSEDMYT